MMRYMGRAAVSPRVLRILTALLLLIPVNAAIASPTGATTGRAAAAAGQPMVWGWGANDFDALIPGASGLFPAPIDGTDGVISVAGTLALLSDHTVLSWGYNSMGEGGTGTISQTSPVHQVPGLTDVTAISQGTFDMALEADGTVWTWGDDAAGQLGRPATDMCGSTPCSTVPGQVPGLDGVRSVVAANGRGFAIKSDGTVWAWGANGGLFGNGDTTGSITPTQVTQLSGVVAIATGEKHALAVKADGTVWTWGSDDFWQLGVPAPMVCGSQYPCSTVPVQVPGLTDMVAVTAGAFYSVALRADGTVWLWGGDFTGQPPVAPRNMVGGDLSASQVIDPQDPTGYLTHVTAIAAGMWGQHTLVLKSDGTVWGWGSDNSWQINTQAPCQSCYNFADNVPTRVVGIEGATALAAGSDTSFAIAPVPDLSASPPGDDFGHVAFGSTSAPNTFTVTNNSASPVHIASVMLANAPNQAMANFSVVSDQCSGAELQPGQSCQVGAMLSLAMPESLGQIEPMALVTVTEDAPEHRQVEQVLAGEGMVSLVDTSSAALDFGDQPLSGQTAPLSLTLSQSQYVSSGESLAMHLRIVGPDAGDFSEIDTCSTALGNGESCTVQVTFAPFAAGPRHASLIVDSKDGVSSDPGDVIVEIQNSVPLSGYGGTPPTATATPSAVPSDTPIPSPTTSSLLTATATPSDTPFPSSAASPSPTAVVAPAATATPTPPASAPPSVALPSPAATSLPATAVAPPLAASPTSPGTPAPLPTDTSVANGHDAPPPGTPDATSTSTGTPVPAPTTAAHHSLSIRSALSVVAQGRVTSGQTLTVHADTAAHARIRVALQVVARRTTMVRLKMKVREVQRAVTLYQAGNTRVADGQGRVTSRLRVTYELASPTRAVLLVTARVRRATLARKTWVTIVPQARHTRHPQSTSRATTPSKSQGGKYPNPHR